LDPAQAGLKSILGPAQLMTQGYFGFCRMLGPRIVGSWGCPSATCTLGCQAPRQATQAPRVHRGVPSTKVGPKRHVSVGGVPSL